MDSGVGAILRKARARRKVELSEVEAATRIRLRYLRAIEDEEWDVLPGGVYTRGFIRTYASFLGLDGERLVEDYRGSVERWHRTPAEQSQAASGGAPRNRPGVPAAALVVVAVVAVAVIAIVAIPGGGGGEGGGRIRVPAPVNTGNATADRTEPSPSPAPKPGVSVELEAGAEVWVCMLNGGGKALVNGLILEAGAEAGPFRSGSFTVSFGNGEVKMRIDGREVEIAATSSPIGYSIDSSGALAQLSESERPTCA
jgi:cytoskeleton protein RodZ